MNGFLNNLPVDNDFGLAKQKTKKDNPHIVIYRKPRCPKCGSPKVPVYATIKPVRYHKCLNCGHLFKSVEK